MKAIAAIIISAAFVLGVVTLGSLFYNLKQAYQIGQHDYEQLALYTELTEKEEAAQAYAEAAALLVGKCSKGPSLDIPLSNGSTVRIPALRPKAQESESK